MVSHLQLAAQLVTCVGLYIRDEHVVDCDEIFIYDMQVSDDNFHTFISFLNRLLKAVGGAAYPSMQQGETWGPPGQVTLLTHTDRM